MSIYGICIQYGTYQQSHNNWHKQQWWFLNNVAKSFISVSDEHFNAGNIVSRNSEVVLPNGEPGFPCDTDSAF